MEIADTSRFRRLATRGTIGLGESYQAGEWHERRPRPRSWSSCSGTRSAAVERRPRLARVMKARPRRTGARGCCARAGEHRYHYDLGNDLFRADARRDDDLLVRDLRQARRAAGRRAAAQAPARLRQARRSRPDDHVLEIGCGWGSFALTAAGEYGARVTGLTLSPPRPTLARERVRAAGLDDRSEIVEQDYRPTRGSYTKIASIEMIEAIGERQFPVFFAACDRLLAPAAARASRRSYPRPPLGPLPALAGLDRALRLPRLPDPLARLARAPRPRPRG